MAHDNGPLWEPDEKRKAESNLTRFMGFLKERTGQTLSSYETLLDFSNEHPELFWPALWDFTGIKAETRGQRVVVDGDKMPGARFFPDARLNFAENLLRRRDSSIAMYFRGEDKVSRQVTWAELYDTVSRAQGALKQTGLGEGQRMAAIMPNMPEVAMAMMGAVSLGAIWSSCSPDFGDRGVLDRFGQIDPTVLIACDGYYYDGKTFDIGERLKTIVEGLPTLEKVIIVNYIGTADKTAAMIDKAVTWDAFLEGHEPGEIEFAQLPFDHPLYILFSSGTTGAPKCIVHSAGAALMQHVKEQQLHCDVKPGDRLFYFTTCGWMMWNWLIGGLASEATLALYDGSPFAPSPNVLFDYIDEIGITVFGTSAKFIDAVRNAGLRPADSHSLESVRAILSTGSPLAPESFDFVYDAIKKDVHLASMSGGTDICGCFVGGNPLGAVWRGEIQASQLAMSCEVWDEDGKRLDRGKGELVCTRAFPSMPVMFWNDPDGSKYHNAYFARYDNIWHHGDFAEITEHGGFIIHGRSDATLNPGGVRIGTAEIYASVERLPEIKEGLAIGQQWDSDVRVVLFVVLNEGQELDEDLTKKIKTAVRTGASPRHVPARVVAVADIPRTKSGKITELAVRDVVHGRDVKNKEALANPEALDLFRDLPELQA